MTSRNSTAQALVRYALVALAAIAGAAVWAQSRPEAGLLLDAQTWEDEVASAATGPWPEDGWFRLVPRQDGVDVQVVTPQAREPIPQDALFFRLRGAMLQTGLRTSERELEQVGAARPGRFSLRVEDGRSGVQYAIGYGGHTYTYVLGPRGARTNVAAVADLDGDGLPDFLVQVAQHGTYLLLSSHAQPGTNRPSAQMTACGC